MYMNIADDVYRNQVEDTELTVDQCNELIFLAREISDEEGAKIKTLLEEGTIHGLNYKGAFNKLKRITGKNE